MRLTPRGKRAVPTTVVVERSSVNDPAVHRCLASALMATSFPGAAAGSEVSLGIGSTPFSQ
jgi:hypothetical protein